MPLTDRIDYSAAARARSVDRVVLVGRLGRTAADASLVPDWDPPGPTPPARSRSDWTGCCRALVADVARCLLGQRPAAGAGHDLPEPGAHEHQAGRGDDRRRSRAPWGGAAPPGTSVTHARLVLHVVHGVQAKRSARHIRHIGQDSAAGSRRGRCRRQGGDVVGLDRREHRRPAAGCGPACGTARCPRCRWRAAPWRLRRRPLSRRSRSCRRRSIAARGR